MTESIKCNLKQCLNYEKGNCDITLPNMVSQIKANHVSCIFFDCDFKNTWQEWKSHGGLQGFFIRSSGRRTKEELEETKKSMRKPREDKGKKREPKPKKNKKENTLGELL